MTDKQNSGNRTPRRYSGGRPKRQVTIKTGDTFVLFDGANVMPCTAQIDAGALVLTNEQGKALRLIRSE